MRCITGLTFFLVCAVLLLACGGEEATEEAAVPDTLAASETAGISMADVAGTWNMRAVPETGDTTATVYQIEVMGDSWTLFLPDRDPVSAVVTTSGDSIIMDAGPFESVRRDGVMVTTHSVYRLEGGRLVGVTVAHYQTSDPDSVLRLRVEGTRAP